MVSHVIIGLKTVKGGKQLKLDPTIFDALQKEKVQVRGGRRDRCRYVAARERVQVRGGGRRDMRGWWLAGIS